MNKVHVSASSSYDIYIDSEILSSAAAYISQIKSPCAVAVISNETVGPLYAQTLSSSLIAAGYRVLTYFIRDGEQYKTESTYLDIIHFLAENHITRTDLIIALGGGVVGDVTGFAAATYLRGVDYIQIPTTLLAMVDSSVGGKTAIDLPQGKNLLGAFCQPKMVLCDLSVLDTLPSPVFIDGCAEVIKYGMLYDTQLFAHLAEHGKNFDRAYVIERCIALKADVVADDEFDTGSRQKLNLGHTIGHAIEKNSCYSISHGQAVAIGMAIITNAAAKAGACDMSVSRQLQTVLQMFGLPICTPCGVNYSSSALYASALSDKKRSGGTVNLIIPQAVGNCIIQKTEVSQLESIIESGL